MPESPPSSLPLFPPPWTCRADFYLIPFYTTPSTLPLLSPDFLHAPLEASHEPSLERFSRPVGGIGMLQIIRYKDTPVGSYDEMLVIPGPYAYAHVEEGDGKKGRKVEGKGFRITRIYVSQRETCYNGRKIWNIPKHLANFNFSTNADSSLTLSLHPHDSDSFSTSSSSSSSAPFFTTTFKPTPYLPRFPLSLTALSPLLSTLVVLPPVPSDASPEVAELICGTDRWCAFSPRVKSGTTRIGWFDMQQQQQQQQREGGEEAQGSNKFFWPGWGRWRVGIFMQDADMVFEKPTTWSHTDAREVRK